MTPRHSVQRFVGMREIATSRPGVERKPPTRATRRTLMVLHLIVIGIAAVGTVRAVDTARTPSPADSGGRADVYEQLRERIQTAHLLELNDPTFPETLIIGGRRGGPLTLLTIVHDPLMPNTLDVYFDRWNLSARASLLLAYASLVTESDEPRHYVGIPDDERRKIDTHRAEERTRIAQLAHAGGYEAEWHPFVVAYRQFRQVVERAFPPPDTPDSRGWEVAKAIGHLAREQGVYRLIREVRIDPADVSNEILRLLEESRAQMGAPIDTRDHGASLLYTCDSAARSVVSDPKRSTNGHHESNAPRSSVAVHVHSWHSLAPAFFRAWEAADKKPGDPQATLIMTVFERLSDEINVWAVAHPEADSPALDRALNQMAANRGLITLLEHFGGAEEPHQTPSPQKASPVSKPGSKE